jgi:hypothetical protein
MEISHGQYYLREATRWKLFHKNCSADRIISWSSSLAFIRLTSNYCQVIISVHFDRVNVLHHFVSPKKIVISYDGQVSGQSH